jgi:Mg/Co/Ni transporter MgtE
LHQKRKVLSKIQILEFSILFIILNYLEIALKKIEELSEIKFLSEKNESLKNEVISSLTEGNGKEVISKKIYAGYNKIIKEINENSNIQIIIKNKNNEEVLNLFDELLKDHKEEGNLRKIETLEQKLINNLDENSYSELIRLKSQLNRE